MLRRLRNAYVGAALVGTLVLVRPVTAQPSRPPKDSDVTCPYLRQQRIDRHAPQIADTAMGRDVIDNLRLLKQADNLLELAKDLARDGFIMEAMECCNRAAELCPGSPCAQRATDAMRQLALGSNENQTITMPNPKYMPDSAESDPGAEQLVASLIDSCYILMSRGMQDGAAKLARRAYALAPQRVLADPLIYKMHLLGDVPATQPGGANEASEPPTCPYCPNAGKPIREIVPDKKPSAVDYEFEVNANACGLRMCADCSMNGNVYHVRFKNGCLTMWKTPDVGKTRP